MKKKMAKMVSKALNATVSKTDGVRTFKFFTGSIEIPSDKKQQEQK